MNSVKKVLILGGSGLVGAYFIKGLQNSEVKLLAPNRRQLDVLNFTKLRHYINKEKPDILINFVAFTDLNEAEKETDNNKGIVWQTNVHLTKILAGACRKLDIFFIHISTDAVFPGTDNFKGPYTEDQIPAMSEGLSWYGETKRQGEMVIKNTFVRFAIVRINYPFGNAAHINDFARKTFTYIISGYPLFTDQLFNPTYLPDLNIVLQKLISSETEGIFHVASKGLITPFKFGKLILQFKRVKAGINKGLVRDFMNTTGNSPRLISGGLDTSLTEKKLGIRFHYVNTALKKFSEQIF